LSENINSPQFQITKKVSDTRVTFLGTASSHGVPVIACPCKVCTSHDVRDRRLRSSIYVQHQGVSILIDAGPDLRQQALLYNVHDLDALLITHEHNDHIIGLDDLRPYNYINGLPVQIFGTSEVKSALDDRFPYIFGKNPYVGALKIEFHEINHHDTIRIKSVEIIPIQVWHGNMEVLGFRFGDFTYITDAKTISAEEMKKIKGSRILVLNALHFTGHTAHFNVDEALEVIWQIGPERAYLTHLSHYIGVHEEVNKRLPDGVELAYDGLQIVL
jgi:phosphoribosyl 1,2-cyclic phosphate phosphodiesterase